MQLYEPIVFLHTVTWLQLCSPVEHSSISGNTANKLVKSPLTFNVWERGSRADAVVIALAFYQCGSGSIPGFNAICGLSLFVLYSAPRGFSPGTPVFPSPQKPTFAGVAQLASARLSEQGVPSSILGDFNVCFQNPVEVLNFSGFSTQL